MTTLFPAKFAVIAALAALAPLAVAQLAETENKNNPDTGGEIQPALRKNQRDAFASNGNVRQLQRVPGALIVRQPQEAADSDAAASKDYEVVRQQVFGDERWTHLRAKPERMQAISADAAKFDQDAAEVRSSPMVRGADPVFIDPANGLKMMLTGEIIFRLKPGVDPQGFFGDEWPQVRRMSGTDDHYLLKVTGMAAEKVFERVTIQDADKQVVWAEPNFASDLRTAARIGAVKGLAIDYAANIYFSDVVNASNHRVRLVSAPSGLISTFAGVGPLGSAGDGGAAASANLNTPFGVVVDPGGRVQITDKTNHRIRAVK